MIKKLDIKKFCIQKTIPLEKTRACTVSQDNLEIKYDANQNVYISLDKSQEIVDVHDSNGDEIPHCDKSDIQINFPFST